MTGFARDYVTTYLSAKAGDEDKLACSSPPRISGCHPWGGLHTPMSPSPSRCQGFRWRRGMDSDRLGVVNGNTSATAQRTFYRVPISVFNGAPRRSLPMQNGRPAVGVDLRLGYRSSVSLESPLAQTAAGFVTAYLTGGTDFTRYVTADSREISILPAPYMRVE